MKSFFIKNILIFTLSLSVFAANGGWRLPAQLYAWTSMITSFSQIMPLKDALTIAFSGKKPCNLCHTIKQSKVNSTISMASVVDCSITLLNLHFFSYEIIDFKLISNFSYLPMSTIWSHSPHSPPPRV